MRCFVCMIILLCLVPRSSRGQGGAMSRCDRVVLETLFRDTVSTVHSSLPAGRNFGISELAPDDLLEILKAGRKILFVSQLTGEVYRPLSTQGPFARLDKNNVFGLEYRVDPFMRRDSLFMIATSRFMKGKGFLAYFDEVSGEWKPYRGNEKVIKESTRPFYDEVNDQLYLVCDYVYDDRSGSATATRDNVLRYTFTSGKWEEIGRLKKEVFFSAVHVPFQLSWNSPFGAGKLAGDELYLLQPAKNRRIFTDSAFRGRMNAFFALSSDTGQVMQMIYMGDTLHAFFGTPDSVRIMRIALTESDFTITDGRAIFDDTVFTRKDPDRTMWSWILPLSLVAGLTFIGYRVWRRPLRMEDRPSSLPSEVQVSTGNSATPSDAPVKNSVHYFLNSLSPVERGLVKELSVQALKGDMMDTQTLNQILGVSHKEPELQKVRRSLTITRINSNFTQILEPGTTLIRRAKDPVDKRVFLYHVTKEHARMLLAAEEGPAKSQSSSSK